MYNVHDMRDVENDSMEYKTKGDIVIYEHTLLLFPFLTLVNSWMSVVNCEVKCISVLVCDHRSDSDDMLLSIGSHIPSTVALRT